MSEENAIAYAAMRAFAASTLRRGESEGLYRAVDDLLMRGMLRHTPDWILDVGCGTGRTLVDAAEAFPNALIVGVDLEVNALRVAHAIAHFRGSAVTADLRRWGFGLREINGHNLPNAVLVRAESEALPFARDARWPGFDAVTCVNLLDRSRDPSKTLSELVRVLAPGGLLVLTTPLDWRRVDTPSWANARSLRGVCDQIEAAGLELERAFDGLVYREMVDSRGSALDWEIAVVAARKGNQAQEAASHSTLL